MQKDYDKIIRERAQHVFDVMADRVSAEDMNLELKTIINHISAIEGVDEVKRLSGENELLNY